MTDPITNDLNREQLTIALTHATAGTISNMVCLAIGLAAEAHPDEIRKALASVFDLTLLEDAARRAMVIVTEAQAKAREIEQVVRTLKTQLLDDLANIEKRIEALNVAVDELESRKCPY